jgi:hypothetical protein
MIEYKVRHDLFEKEKTYSLIDNSLQISGEGIQTSVINFNDIKSVHLAYTPNRYQTNFYTLTITTRGNMTLKIVSASYKGIGEFEPRPAEYITFVIWLHKLLEPHAGGIEFRYGNTPGQYFFYWILVIFGIAVIFGAAVFFLTIGLIPIALVKLLFMLWLLWYSIKYMKKNKPGTYSASDVPEWLLPK